MTLKEYGQKISALVPFDKKCEYLGIDEGHVRIFDIRPKYLNHRWISDAGYSADIRYPNLRSLGMLISDLNKYILNNSNGTLNYKSALINLCDEDDDGDIKFFNGRCSLEEYGARMNGLLLEDANWMCLGICNIRFLRDVPLWNNGSYGVNPDNIIANIRYSSVGGLNSIIKTDQFVEHNKVDLRRTLVCL